MPNEPVANSCGGMSTAMGRDALRMCRDLIRINTANDGLHPERPAAEYVIDRLTEVGVEPFVVEAAEGRTSVVATLPGAGTGRPGLLIHGHLDTVPADADEWSVDPYAGEIRNGCLWGRGAVDMKNMVAMTLAVFRELARRGPRPARPLTVAFVADEESGGHYGAGHLVEKHPELFAHCSDAIGEVGGFSWTLPDSRRVYPVQTGEKGVHWIRLSVPPAPDAAVVLAEAVARIARYPFPEQNTATSSRFLSALSTLVTSSPGRSANDIVRSVAQTPGILGMLTASLRHTANPTVLATEEGVPAAYLDARFLPGEEESFPQLLRDIAGPGVQVEVVRHSPAVESSISNPFFTELSDALRAEDAQAHPIPYLLSAGTDAKWFARLGIECYGFSPLQLPPDFDFPAMFHGADERIPVSAFDFGCRVLHRLTTSGAAVPAGSAPSAGRSSGAQRP